jgi:large subunit ribosomal protein L2
MKPGKGAQIARSAGTVAQIIAIDGDYATLRLK